MILEKNLTGAEEKIKKTIIRKYNSMLFFIVESLLLLLYMITNCGFNFLNNYEINVFNKTNLSIFCWLFKNINYYTINNAIMAQG